VKQTAEYFNYEWKVWKHSSWLLRTKHQVLSEMAKFYSRYDKKHFAYISFQAVV